MKRKVRVLITGASGFIGRNIFESFRRRTDVELFGTYRSRRFFRSANLWEVDLRQENEVRLLLASLQPDVLIQAAAVTSGAEDIAQRPEIHVHDNVIMNAHLLAAAHDKAVPHVILFSCALVYPSEDRLVKETDADFRSIQPVYSAAWVKVACEEFAKFYASRGRTSFSVIRHSNIYGPYDKFGTGAHLVGGKIAEVARAQDGDTIVIWGSGEPKRDLLYVGDLERLVEGLMGSSQVGFQIYNAGWGSSLSVREVTEKIIKVSGKKLSVVCDTTKPEMPTQPALCSLKARHDLRWIPRIAWQTGLARTYKWYVDSERER